MLRLLSTQADIRIAMILASLSLSHHVPSLYRPIRAKGVQLPYFLNIPKRLITTLKYPEFPSQESAAQTEAATTLIIDIPNIHELSEEEITAFRKAIPDNITSIDFSQTTLYQWNEPQILAFTQSLPTTITTLIFGEKTIRYWQELFSHPFSPALSDTKTSLLSLTLPHIDQKLDRRQLQTFCQSLPQTIHTFNLKGNILWYECLLSFIAPQKTKTQKLWQLLPYTVTKIKLEDKIINSYLNALLYIINNHRKEFHARVFNKADQLIELLNLVLLNEEQAIAFTHIKTTYRNIKAKLANRAPALPTDTVSLVEAMPKTHTKPGLPTIFKIGRAHV